MRLVKDAIDVQNQVESRCGSSILLAGQLDRVNGCGATRQILWRGQVTRIVNFTEGEKD